MLCYVQKEIRDEGKSSFDANQPKTTGKAAKTAVYRGFGGMRGMQMKVRPGAFSQTNQNRTR